MKFSHPWPHFVFDNFIPADRLSKFQALLPEHRNNFHQDFDDEMKINYKFLPDLELASYFLGPEFKGFLEITTGLSLKIHEKSLVQLRMMTPQSPAMPAHIDNQEEKSLVCIIYVSPEWQPEYGGEFCLLQNETDNPTSKDSKVVAPISNRLILFQSEDSHWHSVMKVHNWVRHSIIMEWIISED